MKWKKRVKKKKIQERQMLKKKVIGEKRKRVK